MQECYLSRCWFLKWVGAFLAAIVATIGLMIVAVQLGLGKLVLIGCLCLLVLALPWLITRLRPLRPHALAFLACWPLALVMLVWYANAAASRAASGLLYDDLDRVPITEVGLVFGTSDRINGRENLYFRYRIDAAEKLWKAGKVSTLIVSGDNRSRSYNEPQRMHEALMARGIPSHRIVRDYAGLRTLDSVVRGKEIFGAAQLVFITQEFQNERAIYLAKAHGIDAIGFNARDVLGSAGWKTRIREVGARVKMWLDVHFLDTRPRHLGPRENLPDAG